MFKKIIYRNLTENSYKLSLFAYQSNLLSEVSTKLFNEDLYLKYNMHKELIKVKSLSP